MRSKSNWKHNVLLFLILVLVFLSGIGFGVTNEQRKILKLNIPQVINSNTSTHVITLTEKENIANGSFEHATELKSGYEILSTLLSGSDSDFYYFHVDEPSDVRISYKDLPYDYSTYIYTSNKRLIASSQRTGFIASAGLIKIVNPGRYYIQVTTNKQTQTKLPYSITVTILPIFDTSN